MMKQSLPFLCLAALMALPGAQPAVSAPAMTTSLPARTYASVGLVAIICRIDRGARLTPEQLCEAGAAAFRAQLSPANRERVQPMAANDARLLEPGTLAFALRASPVEGASLSPAYGADLLMLSMKPFRAGVATDELFPAAPQLLVLPADGAPSLEAPLTALLGGVARVLESARAFR